MLPIEYLRELVITFGRAFSGAPHWLTWVPGAAVTLVFAAIAWRSLRAARKANEITIKTLQHARLENTRKQMLPLFEKVSGLYSQLSLDTVHSIEDISAELYGVFKLLVKQVWAASYPVTHMYFLVGYKKPNKYLSETDNENSPTTLNTIKKYACNMHTDIYLLSTLSLDGCKKRIDCERKTYNYLRGKHKGNPMNIELLEKAMEKLRQNKPYVFDDKDVPPSQPEDTAK